MKECNKTTRHLPKTHSRCKVVFLRSFIPCLVSVHFSGQSLLEIKFSRSFLSSSSRSFWGFLNELPMTFKHIPCGDDCYSQVLTSKTGRFHAPVLTSKYTTPTGHTCTCAIAFCAGLNGLQTSSKLS